MQPCRAPQSQSLLLGVELELQQMIAECLSSTVGLDGCEIWSRGEESCNCNSSVLLPRQHRWSSCDILCAPAPPATRRYCPLPPGLCAACCLDLC